MSLGIAINKNRIGFLLSYIVGKIPEINLRKLIKIVYKIDETSVIKRGLPITWLDYYAWKKGPVAPEIYDIKNNGGLFSDFVSVTKNNAGKIIVSSISSQIRMQDFSLNELELINEVVDKYSKMSADELSDITHVEGTLWSNAIAGINIDFDKTDGKSEILLSLTELIKCDEDKLVDFEEAQECMFFKKALMQS